jgi:hypothetical protein
VLPKLNGFDGVDGVDGLRTRPDLGAGVVVLAAIGQFEQPDP